ncbi:MAG: gliding motility-associated C-terminal domain-containing protein [Flavitalea sp.]
MAGHQYLRTLALGVSACLIFVFGISIQTHAQQGHNPRSPFGFIENTGQITSLESKSPVSDVLYKLYSDSCDVYVTSRGLSYVFRKRIASKDTVNFHYEVERVDMNLDKASISKSKAIMRSLGSPIPLHAYTTNSSRDTMSFAQKIYFKNVYEKIDWVLYLAKEKNGHTILKYDFILHPGADSKQLRLQYSSNAIPASDSTGSVEIKSRLGTIREGAPKVYEEKDYKPVKVTVGVNGPYISYYFPNDIIRQKTIFDPELYWGTFLTSVIPGIYYNDFVYGTNVETDSRGNIFVLLNTSAGVGFPTLDPGKGAYFKDITSTSSGGIQVVKFDPDGKLLWSTFFGQAASASTMVVNSKDDVYILGHSQDPVPLKNNGGYYNGNFKESFIAKFSNNGILVWSSYMGNNNSTDRKGYDATDIATDKNGRIYITGTATDFGLPFKDFGNGAYFSNAPSADVPVFIQVIDESCNIVWSTLVGGNYDIAGSPHIAVDGNKNIFIVTNPRNDGYPLVNDGGFYDGNTGNNNAVITSFNAQFVMTWSTSIPGCPFGLASVTTDRDNNIFVVGGSFRSDFPTTDPGGGAFMDNVANPTKSSGFILKFTPTHHLVWATRFANNVMIFFKKVIADPICDAIHIAGVMNDNSANVPTLNGGCSDGFYYPAGSSPNATGPIYLTFKSSGKQVYTSVTDFPYEYFDTYWDFNVDRFGNLIYLYGDMRNFVTIPSAIKDPGNGAFFQYVRNNLAKATILMKMRPSGVAAHVNINPGAVCGCNKSVDAIVDCGEAPYTYLWSNGETGASINNICPGKYQVRVMDNNCRDTLIDFEVLPNAADVTKFSSIISPATCKGNNGKITIGNVSGGLSPYTYSINNGAQQSSNIFTNLSPGKYKVTVTSNQNCDQFDSVEVNELLPVTGVQQSIFPVHCEKVDGKIEILHVTGGAAPYSYSTDGFNYSSKQMLDSLSPGKHYLYVKDSSACIYIDSFMVNTIAGPAAVSVIPHIAQCGDSAGYAVVDKVTGGAAPYMYSIDSVHFQSGTRFNGLKPGSYTLTAKDNYGCTVTNNFVIGATPAATVKIIATDLFVCYGTGIIVKADAGPAINGIDYNWNNGGGRQPEFSFPVLKKQTVHIKVTNAEGCIAEDSIIVGIKNCDSVFDRCVIFPNAITPNGDGKNDNFGPAEFKCAVDKYVLKVYNRYGELVFSSTDPDKKWDGLFKGHTPDNTSFVFTCEYVIDRQAFSKQGTFTIIR